MFVLTRSPGDGNVDARCAAKRGQDGIDTRKNEANRATEASSGGEEWKNEASAVSPGDGERNGHELCEAGYDAHLPRCKFESDQTVGGPNMRQLRGWG